MASHIPIVQDIHKYQTITKFIFILLIYLHIIVRVPTYVLLLYVYGGAAIATRSARYSFSAGYRATYSGKVLVYVCASIV